MLIILILFFLLTGGLIWFLVHNDRGSKEPVGALWAAAGFGLLSLIVGIFLETLILPDGLLEAKPSLYTFVAFLVVGFIEEAVKFFPLAFFIWKKNYFNEINDGIIYFAISGLVFGLAEDVGYTALYGAETGFFRLILLPFFHAATTGMIGYFLAKAKVEHKPLTMTVIAWVTVAVLHGVYDFGIGSGNVLLVLLSLAITIGFTAGIFILFMKANDEDKAKGRSAVGHNTFCRSCGKPNTHHMLYCQHCGKLA